MDIHCNFYDDDFITVSLWHHLYLEHSQSL